MDGFSISNYSIYIDYLYIYLIINVLYFYSGEYVFYYRSFMMKLINYKNTSFSNYSILVESVFNLFS